MDERRFKDMDRDYTRKPLREEIDELKQLVIEQQAEKTEKKFKLPGKARVSKSKAKNNYVTVCFINENREVVFKRVQIKEGTFIHDDTPYLATTDYMLTYKSKPFLIVPAWSIKPFSPEQNYDQATREKNTTVGYRLLLNTMKNEMVSTKKKINIAVILIILGIIGAVAYFGSQGGLF